ncbi:MAG TPA: hypothetical protein VLS93_06935 [Anaeromyxobacteraceae bacterium]|nr:hypothetical protein [Anaeromyxobacteraceae bacterium]
MYRLQALLELRAAEVRAARGRLAGALADLARAGAARDEAAAAFDQAAARRRVQERLGPRGVAPAAELAARARHLESLRLAEDRLAAALGAREAERAVVERRLPALRGSVAEARGGLSAMERHRETWEADRRRARERREDAALDEVAASRAAAPVSGRPGRPSRCLPGTRW